MRPDQLVTGLSAFPLTPFDDDVVDLRSFSGIVHRLARSGVDSITALGSTGLAPYLSREERAAVARAAVEHAGSTPVIVGVGALRTRHVLELVEDAQEAGAAAVLLAPLTYQSHTEDDVFELYEDVTARLSVPLIVYDNPGTTHFAFSDELYGRIAALPGVASVKIPGVPLDATGAAARVEEIRSHLPSHVGIGVSGDATAATGLVSGCDAWYSVIAGTVTAPALTITRAAQRGDHEAALAESRRLDPLWELFRRFGSLRVVATIAGLTGAATERCLPRPIIGLARSERAEVATVAEWLGLLAGE